MTAQTARLLVDGNGQIIPNQYYDAATNSFIAGSSSNPLPINQLDGGGGIWHSNKCGSIVYNINA